MGWAERRIIGSGLSLAAALACAGGQGAARTPSPYEQRAAEPAPGDTGTITRIRFARGTSSGILDDSLAAGAEKAYVLGAEKGQVMLAHAIAWEDARRPGLAGRTTVRVALADGPELAAPAGEGPLWSGRLPASGDYVLRVRAEEGPTPFTLAVQIPRRLDVSRDDPTASLSGVVPSRAPVDYMVEAAPGQMLEAEVRGHSPDTHLHVYGLDDGAQLAPLPARLRRFAGRIPAAQEYIVSVIPAGEGERYTLVVTVR